jgi:NhaA family Na+:H+ antiporter
MDWKDVAVAPESPSLFSPGSWAEGSRISAVLRKETVGGALLLVATVFALVWANIWTESYFHLLDVEVGPAALHLDLTLATWAADGLLAIFFFVAGLELKREFVAGDLRDPKRAVVPVAAAVGGMIVPALIYLAIAGGTGPKGWAIPTATDIAFALAVLAVISTHLPTALRIFLLTLAVVDDLLAITVIALFYSKDLYLQWFLLALVPLALFALLVQRGISHWYLLLPLAFATWALVHASGIHATVAGVLLGFMVPVRPLRSKSGKKPATDQPGTAEHFEHLIRPVSAGFAVPVFAFFSAGVVLGGIAGLTSAFSDPIAIGIVAGLLVGKPIGILLATFVTSKVTRQQLQKGLTWPDVTGVAILGGIGFTVSLLIGELAFGGSSEADDHVKIAVLAGSVAAAVVAAVLPRIRNRHYRVLWDEENEDTDHNGIPDIYQRE